MYSRNLAPALLACLLCLAGLTSCFKPQSESYPLGHEKNPLQMALVPSTEAEKLVESADELLPLLEKESGLAFESFVAPSYVAIVEAMSISKVHVAWLPPLAYVFASQRNGDRVALKVIRDGKATYRGQVVVKAGSPIQSFADLKGKRIAFTEQASASGYLYPRALLEENGLDPDTDFGEVIFAGSHDAAILALLNDGADAACSFEDARERLLDSGYPDVMEKTRVLGYTPEIPADNVAYCASLDSATAQKITDALLKIAADPEGARILMELYEIEGLEPAEDSEYDPVRQMASVLGLDLEQEISRAN